MARCWILRALEGVYTLEQRANLAVLLTTGEFVPALDYWLRDESSGWSRVVEMLGGVHVGTRKTADSDADFGSVITRTDALALFDLVDDVTRRMGFDLPSRFF